MGRAKLRMELIPKEKTRITTYHKRKLGIIKKASEFTILCDVHTVMIISPPIPNEPLEVWPENPDQIKKGITSYKSKKGETGKRTYNLNDFFEDRRKKIEDELMKARKKNMEAKYSTWFDVLNSFPEHHLRQFVAKLEQKEHDVRTRLELKKRNMNMMYPYMLNFGNKPPMYHFAGLGLGLGLGNPDPELDHRHVLMNCEPMAPYGYPSLVEYGGNVYDNNLNNPYYSFHQQQAALVQGGMPSQFEPQEHESHVSNGGAGDVTEDRS